MRGFSGISAGGAAGRNVLVRAGSSPVPPAEDPVDPETSHPAPWSAALDEWVVSQIEPPTRANTIRRERDKLEQKIYAWADRSLPSPARDRISFIFTNIDAAVKLEVQRARSSSPEDIVASALVSDAIVAMLEDLGAVLQRELLDLEPIFTLRLLLERRALLFAREALLFAAPSFGRADYTEGNMRSGYMFARGPYEWSGQTRPGVLTRDSVWGPGSLRGRHGYLRAGYGRGT